MDELERKIKMDDGVDTSLARPLSCRLAFFVSTHVIIIIIMYIYHALINAVSAHMIHINLNMIGMMYGNSNDLFVDLWEVQPCLWDPE